ncbi:MAG: SDR family NAD(P)-dependent oxidoreductase [Ignavibacterium sp.]|nr:SDR family NAD(P)-dependent oxidoreductase [Ignavibacterium sp.]MDW8375913.1 SDR family NAD(P)-dependent oxidoreductase [Ignavibacteriales bacterium]
MKKVLLIFGANGELGKGITEVLIQKNFDESFLFDFNFDKNYSSSKQIIISDLAYEENVEKAFEEIKVDKETELYLFSTIGGFWGGVPIWETRLNELEKMLSMNLKTNFNIAKKFSQLVKQAKFGVSGFTSAYTANYPSENKFAYGVSKAALSYLIKCLSIEGVAINLSVFGIAPYIIDTNANRQWMSNANFEEWIKPSEIGELVYSMFINYKINSGNIVELKIRLT